MKIFAISDLHLGSNENKPMEIFGSVWDNHWDKISADWDNKVADDDIVLIAGDISWSINLDGAMDDIKKIAERKGIKIFIRGNHDYWWSSLSKIRALLPPNVFVIQNDAIKIANYIFCGTRGWTVPEVGAKFSDQDKKLYEREKVRLELCFTAAEKLKQDGDKVIALMHFPPFNSRFEDSYFTDIFAKNKVDMVVYGHLHGDKCRVRLTYNKDGIPYFLTSCDQLDNKLILLDI